ncbi:protein of unknown function [Burkholderia multivorans]
MLMLHICTSATVQDAAPHVLPPVDHECDRDRQYEYSIINYPQSIAFHPNQRASHDPMTAGRRYRNDRDSSEILAIVQCAPPTLGASGEPG